MNTSWPEVLSCMEFNDEKYGEGGLLLETFRGPVGSALFVQSTGPHCTPARRHPTVGRTLLLLSD